MNSKQLKSIENLQILLAEHEYTVQTLNDIVTRQDRDIARLKSDFEMLKLQYLDLKSLIPNEDTSSDIPPHY